MSKNPWTFDNENLTITFDCRQFKHIYYASNKEIYEAKLRKFIEPNLVKLHLGCGNEHLDGYTNIDAKKSVATDVVCDCTVLPYEDESIDEIICYHMIEHLSQKEQMKALSEWYRVLKPNGKFVFECPDLLEICKLFVTATDEERYFIGYDSGPALIYHIYGNQGNEFEFHKFGFTKTFIIKILQLIGFQNICFGESHKNYRIPCIHVECTKTIRRI
jgi:SAM-dependent methyltransferase